MIIEYRNTIPAQVCSDIIKEIKKSNERFLVKHSDFLLPFVKGPLIEHMKKLGFESSINLISQCLAFESSELIEDHIDSCDKITPEGLPYIRPFSFFVHLNTVPEGGELIFSNKTIIKPVIGKMVVFPPDLVHRVTKSIAPRYLIRSEIIL